MFKLVIQDDEGKTTVVPLIRDEITIGRKEGNTIRLTERNVSRRHARILRNNGEVQIEDLGSYNGIRVNNARIAERVALRVSDQVQIGDYKLYLKAEGVEQVDDARTMPIERVENGATATESMPAVAAPAPTAPVPVVTPPAPTAPPGAVATPPPGVVGNPSRTLVEMDGSMLQKLREAQQRPIADPAVVAKLSETASYGKFVVLSSNFAGKEFELSRPQMIVGRTDDNAIVINHRSISRNHAKVVRDPDTGRYTISDLQSSNGVRVNGQDYTKVELRRGDVVDLGHVRLRFVEPGEDFIFNPSMVTDVPEGGGKKGLMAAVVIAVLLVGAIGVYFAFLRNDGGGGNGTDNGNTNGTNGNNVVAVDAKGSDIAMNPPPVVADAADVAPPVVDAGQTVTNNTPSDAEIEARCNELKAKEKWLELESCAKDLQPFSPDKATTFRNLAKSENGANVLLAKLKTQVQTDQLDNAKKTLDQIDKNSIYRAEADTLYNNAHEKMINSARATAANLAKRGECEKLDAWRARQSPEVAKALGTIECTPKQPGNTGSAGSGSNITVAPQPSCAPADVAAHRQAAQNAYNAGNYTSSLAEYDIVLKCAPDDAGDPRVYAAACAAHAFPRAKQLFVHLMGDKDHLAQICLNYGFDPRK